LFKKKVCQKVAMGKISYFPHPFSGKQNQNLFTCEIVRFESKVLPGPAAAAQSPPKTKAAIPIPILFTTPGDASSLSGDLR